MQAFRLPSTMACDKFSRTNGLDFQLGDDKASAHHVTMPNESHPVDLSPKRRPTGNVDSIISLDNMIIR